MWTIILLLFDLVSLMGVFKVIDLVDQIDKVTEEDLPKIWMKLGIIGAVVLFTLLLHVLNKFFKRRGDDLDDDEDNDEDPDDPDGDGEEEEIEESDDETEHPPKKRFPEPPIISDGPHRAN